MNSKLHTQKNIVTVGELVDMVKNQNWKRDMSYIMTERQDPKTQRWKEMGELEPVNDVHTIEFNTKNGVLLMQTPESSYLFSGLVESSLMREVVTHDNPELRCTIYTT